MFRLTLLVCSFAVFHALATPTYYDLDKAEELFEEFIEKHNRNYEDEAEKSLRFNIFVKSLIKCNELNRKAVTAEYGLTKFADMTAKELQQYGGLLSINASDVLKYCDPTPVPNGKAPNAFDWRSQNGVTDVKSQGTCGSCWAFATTGNIESQYLLKHGQKVLLSEQQLVDCDLGMGEAGCDGSNTINSIEYVRKAGGLMSEDDYPYRGMDGLCTFDQSKVQVKVSGCKKYNCSEEDLKKVLKDQGPLMIGVAATDFVNYHSGILDNCDPNGGLNHLVLLVGYGEENNVPFWVIKNSWGETFGEKGYIRVKRGVGACNMLAVPVSSAVL